MFLKLSDLQNIPRKCPTGHLRRVTNSFESGLGSQSSLTVLQKVTRDLPKRLGPCKITLWPIRKQDFSK